MGDSSVPLSVCVPTYNRPDLLERALSSVVSAPPDAQRLTELVVSDNSTDEASEAVYRRTTVSWEGPTRYQRNRDSPGMVGNFNRCVEAASGRHVLLLHDDDYLLPGGLEVMHRALAANDREVLLFGVHVVDAGGRVRRRQTPSGDVYLPPARALGRVLSHSSFVRFPAIVVRHDAYAEAGPFDPAFGGATDFDMWVRLFGRFGVQCVPEVSAAYVVHPEAHTSSVFTAETIDKAVRIFGQARSFGMLDERTLRRCQAAWFHQFILGGAFRSLRAGDRAHARSVLRLFQLPAVRAAGPSSRWLPLRAAFSLATVRA